MLFYILFFTVIIDLRACCGRGPIPCKPHLQFAAIVHLAAAVAAVMVRESPGSEARAHAWKGVQPRADDGRVSLKFRLSAAVVVVLRTYYYAMSPSVHVLIYILFAGKELRTVQRQRERARVGECATV